MTSIVQSRNVAGILNMDGLEHGETSNCWNQELSKMEKFGTKIFMLTVGYESPTELYGTITSYNVYNANCQIQRFMTLSSVC